MIGKKNKSKISIDTGKDNRFADIKFRGTFREYQQKVVDNFDKHIKNGKIHIVAAPGSGKTILGLELIRMLGKPALVLSPTIAIREQWKERFEEMFVPENENVNDFVSCSLLKPRLLTSITYQGLYTSYRRIAPVSAFDQTRKAQGTQPTKELSENTDADEYDNTHHEVDDAEADVQLENYSGVNIIKLLEEHKISILCLDEAHHLRAEWQKALYEFVSQVEHNVTIIALTATPPYDSKKSEWDKYIAMCGPIDDEIFVPELVRAKTLCPHQDYIYYSFPTADEIDIIKKYQVNVDEVIKDIFAEGKFLEIIQNSEFYRDVAEFEDELCDKPELVKAICAFLEQAQVKAPKRLRASLERDDRNIIWDLSTAEILFQGMISDDQLFSAKDREYVKSKLSRHGLVENGKVCLITNNELEKLLFSSIGKLKSISTIVKREYESLGDNIRLLVLTDYIRQNSQVLGTDIEIKEMGVVPIFELLRRLNLDLKLAALSGKIIIVPNNALDGIKEIAEREKTRMKIIPIMGTEHSELKFESANSAGKIGLITKAFNAGIINCLVGTKSLLGEGWDSPVINTLILGSYVGSFMLSNQMRGRAVRIDRNRPDKVSNIWHLTAILPDHLQPDVCVNFPPSKDYAVLERRFQGFMGLHYTKDIIESTLDRAKTIAAPFDEKSINSGNEKTFELARDRDKVCQRWRLALADTSNEVVIQNEIPKPKKGFIPALIMKPSHFSVTKKVAYATIKTFKELGIINKKAKALVEKDYSNKSVSVGILRCSKYEKSLFHQAIGEVFGQIDNPKYILIKTKNDKPDYRCAFSVPEIFAGKKINAEIFQQKMNRRIKHLELFFTRSADGKKHLSMAKKKAYVNRTNNELGAKMKLSSN